MLRVCPGRVTAASASDAYGTRRRFSPLFRALAEGADHLPSPLGSGHGDPPRPDAQGSLPRRADGSQDDRGGLRLEDEEPRRPPESAERLSRRVLLSTISNYAGYGTTLLIWFFLTPFVVSQLGPEAYGLFVLATAVMSYGTLLDLGVTGAVIRFVAELHEREDLDELRSVVVTAMTIAMALFAVTLCCGLVLAWFAPDLFQVPADQRETTRTLMVVAAAAQGLAFPSGVLFAVLQGMQRFDISNALNIIATLLQAALVIVGLLAGLGVVWVVATAIPTSLLVQVPAVLAVRRAAPDMRLSAGRPRPRLARQMLSFSWAVLVAQGAEQVKTRTDEIVIGAMLPVANVAPYSLARRGTEAPVLLTYQFAKVLMPLSAQLGARNEHERLRAVFVTGTRVTLAAFLTFSAGIVVLAGPFLAAWVGSDYAGAADIMVILALAAAIGMLTWTGDSVMQGISRHRPLALFAVIGALLNLGLSIALIGPLGIEGVALGTLIASVVETAFLATPYAMRVLGVGLGTLVRGVLVPVLIPAIPAIAVAAALREVFDPTSLVGVLAVGAAAGGAYLAGYLLFGASAGERALALQALRAVRRRVASVR